MGFPGPAPRAGTRVTSRRYAAMVWGDARRAASSIRNCSSASRTDGFGLELGSTLQASQGESLLLGLLLDQEGCLAVRARRRARTIPCRELAIGVAIASVERLAAFGPALGELALPALGATNAERDRFGELAVGSTAARDEAAVRTVAHDQRRATQIARAFHRDRQLGIVD